VRAVLVVSLMFAILHLHLGLVFVSMVLVGSLFFGMLYLRHGTLVGVIIVHYILGILMQFLGFM
jgi:membrane protease YdiL (CAAX protease family)